MLEMGVIGEMVRERLWSCIGGERRWGHAGSLYHLASCVETGVGGVKKDMGRAVRIYEEARKKGSHQAETRLAELKSLTTLSSPPPSTPPITSSFPHLTKHSASRPLHPSINVPRDSGKLVSIDSWGSVNQLGLGRGVL
ncbi:hypothetical protein BC829DRAFT_293055 [Chytridium lagenaria]|nr:hypothetical protein BC829DRAFT_293055 [Chytridium lagenaria]